MKRHGRGLHFSNTGVPLLRLLSPLALPHRHPSDGLMYCPQATSALGQLVPVQLKTPRQPLLTQTVLAQAE